VHLFVADGYIGKTKTVRQRYIGQVMVDPVQPFDVRLSTSDSEPRRQLLVFRLRPAPDAELVLTKRDELQPAAATTVLDVPMTSASQTSAPGAKAVPAEQHGTDKTTANIAGGPVAIVRREGQLTTAFKALLEEAGHDFHRHQITVAGEPGSLMTDLYDGTDNVLYEAKGKSRRNDVRMAVGQLRDYRRHLNAPPGLRLAVLLPGDPGADLRDFLAAEKISLVTQTENGFEGFPLEQS
jgi:hypothetical protein